MLTTSNAEDIRKELLPVQYETETRGKRSVGPATPAGEGKYSIVKHGNHTELAYVLELPQVPGPTQKEFEIKKEASYIISVKNPDIQVPGFKAFEERKPEYSSHIKEKFGDRRWINVEEPDLLNYENTQVLLIGARKRDVEEELGIDLNEEKETVNTAELFRELKMRKEQVPLKPLLKGEFPGREEMPAEEEAKQLSGKEAPGRKGGKAGGRAAASRAPSAAALSKALAGVDFPKRKDELKEYAQRHIMESGLDDPKAIVDMIGMLPDKEYHDMSDVEKSLFTEA